MVVRHSGDALHNGVAVLLPICQREKNKKHRWGQREQMLQVIRNAVGGRHTVSVTDTSPADILSRVVFRLRTETNAGLERSHESPSRSDPVEIYSQEGSDHFRLHHHAVTVLAAFRNILDGALLLSHY